MSPERGNPLTTSENDYSAHAPGSHLDECLTCRNMEAARVARNAAQAAAAPKPSLTSTVRRWAERHGIDFTRVHKWNVVRELGMPGEDVPEVLNLSIEMPPRWREEPSILGPSIFEVADRAAAMLGVPMLYATEKEIHGQRVVTIVLAEKEPGTPPLWPMLAEMPTVPMIEP